MKNIGVILAGGSGRRLGSELPKQFIVIAGKTVLAHTLHTFEKHERIDEIILVVHKDYIKETEEIVRLEGFQKVKHIVRAQSFFMRTRSNITPRAQRSRSRFSVRSLPKKFALSVRSS